jgi:tetrapyrrole methylase family protein/MazG family protein
VLLPGLSFLDLAWLRLGVDPTAGPGARAVDGQALPAALPAGPVLISHCHNRLVLSDVKLALLERLPGDAPVTVLARLGLPDESVTTVALEDLDRAVEPDHLTSVFADLPPGGPGEAWERLVALIERLRAPGGCPWDAEQTHHTLARHLIEEAYEVIEAIEALPATAPAPGPEPVPEGAYEHLEEELGDLACQVVFHATFAREAGAFTVTDVLTGIHDKLVRRHPHVFADVAVSGADEVVANWEVIKREEKGRASLMDGVSRHLPSLLYAHKLYRKAGSAGLTFGTADDARARVQSELAALDGGEASSDEAERHLGEALAAVVHLARLAGIDGESALRGWAGRFKARFQALEAKAAEQGTTLESMPAETVATLWEQTA